MANSADYYVKLMAGDLMLALALAKAEVDQLKEENATLRAQVPKLVKPEQPA